MTYYPTLDEDLARAKEILEKGKPAAESLDGVIDAEGRITEAVITWGGATIYGGDVYAAYKLLESFVAEITDLRRWKDAVSDACITDWIFTREHDTNPRKAVNDLLVWQARLALDPAVSQEAAKLHARIEDLEAAIKGAETLVSVNMQTIAKQQEALTAMTGRNVQLLLEVEQLRVQNADFLSLIRELRLALEGQSPESHH